MGWVDGVFGGLAGWAQHQAFETHQATRPAPGPTRWVDLPIRGAAQAIGEATVTTTFDPVDVSWTTLPSGWSESGGYIYPPTQGFFIAAAYINYSGGATSVLAVVTTSTETLVWGLGSPSTGISDCGPGAIAYAGPASQGIGVGGATDAAGTADISMLLYRLPIEGT